MCGTLWSMQIAFSSVSLRIITLALTQNHDTNPEVNLEKNNKLLKRL